MGKKSMSLARRRKDLYKSVNLKKLRKLLSDKGLDKWAKKHGLPVPSEMAPQRCLAARTFYGEIAPGFESLKLKKSVKEFPYLKETIVESVNETIDFLEKQPPDELEKERSVRMSLPAHIKEFGKYPPGGSFLRARGGDERGDSRVDPCDLLIAEKAVVIGLRAGDRNKQLLKGALSIVGLDIVIDLLEEDEEDRSFLTLVLDALIVGDWALAVKRLVTLTRRFLARPGLWSKFVKRFGRFGALKYIIGVSGRLVPAILIISIAVNWALIYAEWREKAAEYDERFKQIYDGSDCGKKDKIFKENLGYIPE